MTLAVALALSLVACEERGPRSEANVDYVCALDEPGCEPDETPGHCLAIVATATEGGARRTLPIFDPDIEEMDAPDGGFGEIRFLFGEVAEFDIPAVSPMAQVELEFRYYQGFNERPTYGAILGDVTARLQAGEALEVVMYPVARWARPGVTARLGAPVARAFHQAIPLPSGDVLIVGGVQGLGLTAQPGNGAAAVGEVELYDESAHTYVRVVTEGVETEAFVRALSSYRYLGVVDGEHRIRMIGGVTTAPGDDLLDFEAEGPSTIGGAPVVPHADAVLARTFDLFLDLSDPTQPTITHAEDVTGTEPLGVSLALSDPAPEVSPNPDVNDASGLAIPELIGGATLSVGGRAYGLGPTAVAGDAFDLAHARLGASLTALADGSVLVLGGNLGPGVTDVTGTAAEVVVPADATSALATFLGAPQATGFHRALRVGDDVVLVVGGFDVVVGGDGQARVLADVPPAPIRLLEVGPGPMVTVLADLPAGDYASSVFHTLTDLGDGRYLVIGGGTRGAGAGVPSRLVASDQVGVITGAGYEAGPAPLNVGRFGHTTTRLPGQRVLVHGGFSSSEAGDVLNPSVAPSPELLYLPDLSRAGLLEAGQCVGQAGLPDAGPRQDAGLPARPDAGVDAGPPIPDAGPSDAGEPDAG